MCFFPSAVFGGFRGSAVNWLRLISSNDNLSTANLPIGASDFVALGLMFESPSTILAATPVDNVINVLFVGIPTVRNSDKNLKGSKS